MGDLQRGIASIEHHSKVRWQSKQAIFERITPTPSCAVVLFLVPIPSFFVLARAFCLPLLERIRSKRPFRFILPSDALRWCSFGFDCRRTCVDWYGLGLGAVAWVGFDHAILSFPHLDACGSTPHLRLNRILRPIPPYGQEEGWVFLVFRRRRSIGCIPFDGGCILHGCRTVRLSIPGSVPRHDCFVGTLLFRWFWAWQGRRTDLYGRFVVRSWRGTFFRFDRGFLFLSSFLPFPSVRFLLHGIDRFHGMVDVSPFHLSSGGSTSSSVRSHSFPFLPSGLSLLFLDGGGWVGCPIVVSSFSTSFSLAGIGGTRSRHGKGCEP